MTNPQEPGPLPSWQARLWAFLRPLMWLWEALLRLLKWSWEIVRLFVAVLAPTRVALLLIVAALLMLLFHEQGQDLTIALVEDSGNTMRWSLFLVATLWWSIQSWLWSRIALDRKFGPREDLDPSSESLKRAIGSSRTCTAICLVEWIPRLYALLVFVLAVVAILQAGGFATRAFWVFSALGVVTLGLLWWRRKIFERMKEKAEAKAEAEGKAVSEPRLARRLAEINPALDDAIMGRSPGARILAWSALVLALATTTVVTIDVVGVGALFGAPSISFMAFASILVVLGIPAGLGARFGFPLITTLLIVAGILGGLLPDAHTIPFKTEGLAEHKGSSERDAEAGLYTGRRSVDEAWTAWRTLSTTEAPRPIAFVATAGGGVRAALWTSIVLDRAGFADTNRNHLFAVSGVSGGALGATFYQAWLGADGPSPSESCPKPSDQGDVPEARAFGRVTACALTFDQLGPAFAGAFYGDLLYTFTPFWFLPESASALTGAWEAGWRRAVACPIDGRPCTAREAFSRNFLSAWKPREQKNPNVPPMWMPALFLNGTHVESGKRIITSDIRLSTTTMEDAWDFHAITRRDISTSMAALNASRFPGLVAGGTIVHNGERWGHVVDGGYFENSGGQTLAEVAYEILKTASRQGTKVRPIFIEIVSDPSLKRRDYARECVPPKQDCKGAGPLAMESAISKAEGPLSFLIGVTGPIFGLANVRSGRGVLTPKLLARAAAASDNSLFVQFRLCPPAKDGPEVPLGWLLSKASATSIAESLPTTAPDPNRSATPREICRANNWDALTRLENALAGKP